MSNTFLQLPSSALQRSRSCSASASASTAVRHHSLHHNLSSRDVSMASAFSVEVDKENEDSIRNSTRLKEFSLPSASSSSSSISIPESTDSYPTSSSSRAVLISALVPVLISLVVSSIVTICAIATLPIPAQFPRTISDVRSLASTLHTYSSSESGALVHVLAILAITTLWKNAWSIPGSVVLNVLIGTLLPSVPATLIQTFLTTLGSILATLVARPLAPVVMRYIPKAVKLTHSTLQGSSSSSKPTPIWVRLSIMRLIGIVPWSGLNIACGVTDVSLVDCFIGAMIGTLPWTAVTVQVGSIIKTVANNPYPGTQTISTLVFSPEMLLRLAFLTIISIAPIIYRDRLAKLISSSQDTTTPTPTQKPDTRDHVRTHKKRISLQWWRQESSEEHELNQVEEGEASL